MQVVREVGNSAKADVETPLMDAGVDSLAATELSSRLRALSGVASLSPTLVFEHPTPRAIADHLMNELAGVAEVTPSVAMCAAADATVPLALGAAFSRWPGGVHDDAAHSALQTACGDAMGLVPAVRCRCRPTPVRQHSPLERAQRAVRCSC